MRKKRRKAFLSKEVKNLTFKEIKEFYKNLAFKITSEVNNATQTQKISQSALLAKVTRRKN